MYDNGNTQYKVCSISLFNQCIYIYVLHSFIFRILINLRDKY